MENKIKKLNDILGYTPEELEAELLNYWMLYCYEWAKNAKAYQLMLANTAINNWYNNAVKKQTDKFIHQVRKMDNDGIKISCIKLRDLYQDYLNPVWNHRPYMPEIYRAYPKKQIYDRELKMDVFTQLNMN